MAFHVQITPDSNAVLRRNLQECELTPSLCLVKIELTDEQEVALQQALDGDGGLPLLDIIQSISTEVFNAGRNGTQRNRLADSKYRRRFSGGPLYATMTAIMQQLYDAGLSLRRRR